jgi:hypothetical protein
VAILEASVMNEIKEIPIEIRAEFRKRKVRRYKLTAGEHDLLLIALHSYKRSIAEIGIRGGAKTCTSVRGLVRTLDELALKLSDPNVETREIGEWSVAK